ncbi:hypothetical protein K788_0001226 (plasmid) [Paraburkholderia caribensis MBA4]|uniref:Uncharacterized protein n=1 Tax=Paraburkholderia caribensis MBA4 TaxID=1323664 RepID=A0A0P0RNC6_9BURK|nr:hypothetical protein K788_0001226 [Paraburkholderia caribensis MBA4]
MNQLPQDTVRQENALSQWSEGAAVAITVAKLRRKLSSAPVWRR